MELTKETIKKIVQNISEHYDYDNWAIELQQGTISLFFECKAVWEWVTEYGYVCEYYAEDISGDVMVGCSFEEANAYDEETDEDIPIENIRELEDAIETYFDNKRR